MNEQKQSMEPQTLISIIVPVYNAEKFLEKCVDSIVEQTYQSLEIILVDDGSTDHSPEICDQLSRKDPRILVIHQKNAGVSAARNAGIGYARGEYLAFIDGDDYISPYMMEHLYSRIVEDHSEVAVCGYRKVDEEGYELSVATIPDAIVSGPQAIRMHYNQTAGIMMIPVDKLYHRKLFETVRFPLGKRCEDEATFYRILDLCDRVSILAEPLYFYVQHEDSFMGREYSVERLDGVEAFYDRYMFYRDHGERYQDLLQPEGKLFVWLFYDVMRQFQPNTDEERKRVNEVCKMGREMCSQCGLKWTLRERMKLLFPEIYVKARRTKDKLLQGCGQFCL